jgi:hypothetical protein
MVWYTDEMNEEYQNATVEKKSFDPLPDGNYQVIVDTVKLKKTQKTDKPMLVWEFKIVSGDNKGRKIFKNDVLDPNSEYINDKLKYLKGDLSVCDVELKELGDLENSLHKLLDKYLEITLKTKGDNQNIFINRQLVKEVSEDDIPF